MREWLMRLPCGARCLAAASLIALIIGICLLAIVLLPDYGRALQESESCPRSHAVCGLGMGFLELEIFIVSVALVMYPSLWLLVLLARRRWVTMGIYGLLTAIAAVVTVGAIVSGILSYAPLPTLLLFAFLWLPLAVLYAPSTWAYIRRLQYSSIGI